MPIISISQPAHSGADDLARELHARLGYPMVSQDQAMAVARQYGLSKDELDRGLDQPANLFERFTRRKQRYVLAMQAALGELLADGNGIFYGLAGQFLLSGAGAVLKVRVIAPTESRVRRAMAGHGMSKREAEDHLRETDERRITWGRQVFDADPNDPDQYDLVVSLEQMTPATAADSIADLIRRTELPGESPKQFADFALARRVEAALHFNSPFNADAVDVAARGGVVQLSGGRAFEEVARQVADFVRRVPGVDRVVADVGETASLDLKLDADMALGPTDATARDIMLPPDRYPHCTMGCTVREAIVALSASTVRLEDGHLVVPRYLLVLDEDDNLVGIVSRRELLRGLLPQLRRAQESEAHIRELVPFGGRTPSELLIRWTSFFRPAALAAASQSIRPIVAEIKGAVQASDSLSTVISTMLHHGVDLVPVLEGRRVVGVVLMTNVFDIVAQFVIEHGGRVGKEDHGRDR
jgi:cytidylate kinase